MRLFQLYVFASVAFVALGACRPLRPPLSTAPAPTPSARSAWVVFFNDDLRRFDPVHTVRDEEGQILGRVLGRSWFAVERPPGLQWFFTGGDVVELCSGDPARGVTNVGAIATNLEVGRIYLVRVAAYEGTRRSIAGQLQDFRRGCCVVDGDEDWRPDFVDLVGVRPGGTEWNRALNVLREGVRYSAAPRGLDERRVSNIPAQGRGRVGHRIDTERSQLSVEDGSPFWPLTPTDPTNPLEF